MFKKRFSNVIAWIMFPISSLIIVILIAKMILITQKESVDMCVNDSCQFLSYRDIYNSPNLQSLNAKPDDWIEDNKLYRAYPEWVHDYGIKELGDSPNEVIFFFISTLFFLSIFNYLIIGKFRFIPWKKIQ